MPGVKLVAAMLELNTWTLVPLISIVIFKKPPIGSTISEKSCLPIVGSVPAGSDVSGRLTVLIAMLSLEPEEAYCKLFTAYNKPNW